MTKPVRTVNVGCTSCGRPVTTTLVFHLGQLFCSATCAASREMAIPGQFLG